MKLNMSDQQFLENLNLDLASMKGVRKLKRAGKPRQAALEAARVMFSRPFCNPVDEAEIPRLAEIIRSQCPDQVAYLRRLADNYFLKDPTDEEKCGRNPEDEHVYYGVPRRNYKERGEAVHMLARLHHLTGRGKYLRHAILHAREWISRFSPLPDGADPGMFDWHPGGDAGGLGLTHCVQNMNHALPFLRTKLSLREALMIAKALLAAADCCYRCVRLDVMFNIPLHLLTAAHTTGISFPEFKDSALWRRWAKKRLIVDLSGEPTASEDGYFREGFGYQRVNHCLMLMNMSYLRASGRGVPRKLRRVCEKTFEFASAVLRNDGKHAPYTDGATTAPHEHYIDSHEILHLAAALFRRRDFKAAAGSPYREDPLEYNVWLMGSKGYAWWKKARVPARSERVQRPADLGASGFQVLGGGKGLDAHQGILMYACNHNHAHHDVGSLDIYGLGRPLITERGTTCGYGDVFCYMDTDERSHNVAALVRRRPSGPRLDSQRHARTLHVSHEGCVQSSTMEHSLYESHLVRRTLAFIDVDAVAGRQIDEHDPTGIWIVADRIARSRPWPKGVTSPYELIETFFHFNAPETELGVERKQRSAWSRHEDGDRELRSYVGAERYIDRPSKTFRFYDALKAREDVDSDANLQVSAIAPSRSGYTMDMSFLTGVSNLYGGCVKRPSMRYRFRGHLPYEAAFMLIPYRGVRSKPYAGVKGEWKRSGAFEVAITLPAGVVRVRVRGLGGKRPKPRFKATFRSRK